MTEIISLDVALNEYKIDVNGSTGDIEIDGTLKVGDITAGDTAEVEEDGTLKFNGEAVFYEDLPIPLSSAKVPAANAPSWVSFVGNLNAYTYDINDYQEFDTELLHGYEEDSDLEFHVHGVTNGATSGDKIIKLEVEYTIFNMEGTGNGIGDLVPTPTIVSTEFTIPDGTPDRSNFYFDITDIVGTGFEIGAMIKGRVRRLTSTGTAPDSDPFINSFGVHYMNDTVGSREEYVK